jgi:hypothetical protein
MENINITTKPSYEVKLFLGSRYQSCDTSFSESILEKQIADFQDSQEEIIPVRIVRTSFISGSSYKESGWEVSIINFPPKNKWSKKYKNNMTEYMNSLARHLCVKLDQKRVTVTSPKTTYIHENLRFLKV